MTQVPRTPTWTHVVNQGTTALVVGIVAVIGGSVFNFGSNTDELKADLQRQQVLLRDLLTACIAADNAPSTGTEDTLINQVGKLEDAAFETEDDEKESWVTYTFLGVLGVGMLFVARFVWNEYDLLTRTVQDRPTGSRAPSLAEFMYYRLDYWVSASAMSKPFALMGLTLVVVVLGGFLFFTVKGGTLGNALWSAWTFVIDSGAHADEEGIGSIIIALVLTVCGMLVFALVVSIISDAISDKFDSLKQGKASVVETGHTLVLGWSDKTLPFIREVATANSSAGGRVIVILADNMEKEEMENEIFDSNIDLKGSSVVVRRGSPTNINDLQHVSANTARSVIVLAPGDVTADEADAWSLRVTLCLKGFQVIQGHAVVEVCDIDNVELVQIVGGDMVEVVVAHNFIGRLIVQSSRQHGLSQILEDLLGFEGNEFYLQEWPQMAGLRFGDILFRFEGAIVLGVRTSTGKTLLNPDDDYIINEDDQIIVLAEDDDSYWTVEHCLYKYDKETIMEQIMPYNKSIAPEKVLLVGWRRDLADLMVEIDEAVDPGSELTLFANVPFEERDSRLSANGRERHKHLKNVTVKHVEGNPIIRRDLERLPIEEYDSIFILAREEFGADMETSDGHSLASLLLVRDIRQQRLQRLQHYEKYASLNPGYKRWVKAEHCTIISEILDARTRHLIHVAKVSDYVMSNQMVSAALAMVAECRYLNGILQELLTSEGNEIYLREAQEYTQTHEHMSFWDIFARARVKKEICLGYLPANGACVLNPQNKDEPRSWNAGDKIVVVAED